MTLFDVYSRAAGIARALITLLTAVLVFLTASGPVADNPIVAKIAVAVTAAIQLLTRFTGAGNHPPTVEPHQPAVIPQQP